MPPPADPLVASGFRIDPDKGVPVVEIGVARIDELFNPLDRAPLQRRDLAVSFKDFLKDCGYWVPLPTPIVVEVRVGEPCEREQEDAARAGIRNYYVYLIALHRSEQRAVLKRMGWFVVVAGVLLIAAIALAPRLDPTAILQGLLLTGLTVGGWVFLWEALSVVFIRRGELVAKIAQDRRWAEAEVRFVRTAGTSATPP